MALKGKHYALFIGLAVLVFILFSVNANRNKLPIVRSIEVNGESVVINYGNAYIKATTEPEKVETYWVNSGSIGKACDGWFWVIPIKQVEAIKASQGDFHCGGPGHAASVECMKRVIFYGADTQAWEKIRYIVSKSHNCVIEVTGARLNIQDHLVAKRQYTEFDPDKLENYYLVRDIRLTQEDYQ